MTFSSEPAARRHSTASCTHALFGRERRALPGRATDKHATHAALDQIFCLPRDHVEIDGSIPVHCSKRCSDEAGQMDGAIGAQWKASLATSVL